MKLRKKVHSPWSIVHRRKIKWKKVTMVQEYKKISLKLKPRNKKIKIIFFGFLFFIAYSLWPMGCIFAQEVVQQQEDEAAQLKDKIAKKGEDFSASLEQLSGIYFEKNYYQGFHDYLSKALREGFADNAEIYFYIALSRQKEVAYWQKSKNWEGVYGKAVEYKKEIFENLTKAENLVKDAPALSLKIKYIKWQAVKEDDVDKSTGLFNGLVNTASSVVKSKGITEVLKLIADELSTLEDKNFSRRLYEVYAKSLTESDKTPDELKAQAENFLKQDNVYLAKVLFEDYLEKLKDKPDVQIKEMLFVAGKFGYSGKIEGLDSVYAEGLYAKVAEIKDSFDANSQYLRAYNLERMKEYNKAFEEYLNLAKNYPDYEKMPRVCFKLGVLAAYAKKNIELAKVYFYWVTKHFPQDKLVLSAFYQMGLLSQWKKDFDGARGFYNAFIKEAVSKNIDTDKNELGLLVKERLKEIDEKKEIKSGLRLALDGIFQQAKAQEHPLNVDVTAKFLEGGALKFSVATSNSQTGCMAPAYSYEWSGETGAVANIANVYKLETSYNSPGIEVVYVAVIGNSGLEGAGFEMVEIE